jgi:hypothetical protein
MPSVPLFQAQSTPSAKDAKDADVVVGQSLATTYCNFLKTNK